MQGLCLALHWDSPTEESGTLARSTNACRLPSPWKQLCPVCPSSNPTYYGKRQRLWWRRGTCQLTFLYQLESRTLFYTAGPKPLVLREDKHSHQLSPANEWTANNYLNFFPLRLGDTARHSQGLIGKILANDPRRTCEDAKCIVPTSRKDGQF